MSSYFSKLFTSFSKKEDPYKKCFNSDRQFDKLYPFSTQVLARKHWTPIFIAKKAASFLATGNNARVLDIGSGVGKFCLSAAYNNPNTFYYGIEQRKSLITQANAIKEKLKIKNACFIHGNFTQLDFRNYDHFYFFNSFYENVTENDKIDENIECSGELYNYYNRHLYEQLILKPVGTRLATLDSSDEEVPPQYTLNSVELDTPLKLWIKTA